jgi:hypothetical protein
METGIPGAIVSREASPQVPSCDWSEEPIVESQGAENAKLLATGMAAQ